MTDIWHCSLIYFMLSIINVHRLLGLSHQRYIGNTGSYAAIVFFIWCVFGQHWSLLLVVYIIFEFQETYENIFIWYGMWTLE